MAQLDYGLHAILDPLFVFGTIDIQFAPGLADGILVEMHVMYPSQHECEVACKSTGKSESG